MELKFDVRAKIQRPVAQVFEAVHNPAKLSSYFTTGSSSGPLNEGSTVTWRFSDFPGDIPVQVKKVVPNQLIVLEWGAADGGYNTRVEMKFEPLDDQSTLVTLTESGWKETQKGLASSYDNCEGWTQMACSLKAFVEYGINLRKGFY